MVGVHDTLADCNPANSPSNTTTTSDENFELQKKLSLYDNTLKMVLDSIKSGELKDGKDLHSLFVNLSNELQVNQILDDIQVNKFDKLKISDNVSVSFGPPEYVGDMDDETYKEYAENLEKKNNSDNNDTFPDECIQQMIEIINQSNKSEKSLNNIADIMNTFTTKPKNAPQDRIYTQQLFDTINDNMEAANNAVRNQITSNIQNQPSISNLKSASKFEKSNNEDESGNISNEIEDDNDDDDAGICECDECRDYNINNELNNSFNNENRDTNNDNVNNFAVQFNNVFQEGKVVAGNREENMDNSEEKLVNLQNLFEDEIASAITNFFEHNKHLFPYFDSEQLKMLTENKPRVSVDAFTKHLKQYQKDRSKDMKDLTFADMADMASYVFEKEMRDRDNDVDIKQHLQQHHQQQLEKHHQLQQEHQNLKLQHQYYKKKHQQLMDQCEEAKNCLDSNPKPSNVATKTGKKSRKKKPQNRLQYYNEPTEEEKKRLQRHCLQMLFMNDSNHNDDQHKQQKKKKNKKKKKNGNYINSEICSINHVGYNNPDNTNWLCELCEYKIVYGEVPVFLTEWLQKKANNQEKMENYQRYLLAQRKERKREQLQRNNYDEHHHHHHQNCEHDHEHDSEQNSAHGHDYDHHYEHHHSH